MSNNKERFIIYETEDGCVFPGVIYSREKPSKKAAIFIHGNGANFYKMNYFKYISNELLKNEIDFISVDNRGREQFTTIHKNIDGVQKSVKAGTIYENFDESILDIQGIVKYAKNEGYEDICLIGESLGTLKIMNYCNMIKDINKVILMSPVDMVNRFRSRVKEKYDEVIEHANKLVKENNSFEMVTNEYSAIKVASTMGKNTNADIFKLEENREDAKTLNYSGYVSIIVGTEDHCSKEWGMEYLEKKMKERFENAKLDFHTILGADHLFKNHEEQLAKQIVESLLNMQ